MKHIIPYMVAGLLTTATWQNAEARTVVVTNVNLRAGPDIDYPIVTRIGRNSNIEVYGCMDDWYWCDVGVGRYRGWMRGDAIYTWYDNRRITYVEAGPRLNVPIISFNIGYWDEHYRGRPFYHDRGRWEHYGYRDRGRNWHGRDDHDDHDRGRGHGRGHDWH